MEIIVAKPPMYEEIAKAFNLEGLRVIFSWGDKIYNPSGCEVSGPLKAHEGVHGQRQMAYCTGIVYGRESPNMTSIRAWWQRYITDPEFRFAEEIIAHRAEYHALAQYTKDRNRKAQHLHIIATKLASPLYGGVASYTQARRAIAA